jgi:streptomycin 3"-adenylyltransferase
MTCVPVEINAQVTQAVDLLRCHLADSLQAVHLYGSAVDGGLKPESDIDLLVTVSKPLQTTVRQALLSDLLTISAPPGRNNLVRPLEVTVVIYDEVTPWRYPPRRELQYGEWLRQDITAGIMPYAVLDPDLAILITKARQHSIALIGPPADTLFAAVPKEDLMKAMADALALWNSPGDWQDDARNVLLTLARIWYSTVTGQIAPKDVAAAWVLERLSAEHQFVLSEARAAYLGEKQDKWAEHEQQTTDFIHYAKSVILWIMQKQLP